MLSPETFVAKNSEFQNNSRTNLKKEFFQVHFLYQKNSEQFKEFKVWAP